VAKQFSICAEMTAASLESPCLNAGHLRQNAASLRPQQTAFHGATMSMSTQLPLWHREKTIQVPFGSKNCTPQ